MKFFKTLLVLIALGLVMVVFYGVPDMLLTHTSLEAAAKLGGVLFLFGVWAGIVFTTEKLRWRHAIHAVVFAAFGVASALLLASPTSGQIAVTFATCAAVGYFGERWVQHL